MMDDWKSEYGEIRFKIVEDIVNYIENEMNEYKNQFPDHPCVGINLSALKNKFGVLNR